MVHLLFTFLAFFCGSDKLVILADTSLVTIVFLHCFKNSEVAVETIESFNLFNYVTGMYRDCLLHKNEQETLLSFNQQLVVIQIILVSIPKSVMVSFCCDCWYCF